MRGIHDADRSDRIQECSRDISFWKLAEWLDELTGGFS
jgi:exoribonuclease R